MVLAVAGERALDAVELTGASALRGKVLIDVTNPLDFSHGMPPSLTICKTDSLAEAIQRALPETRVIKSLNTMNLKVMVAPAWVPGAHVAFVSGDDRGARAQVAALLGEMGWRNDQVMDLGDLSAARGLEMFLPLWLRLMATLGTGHFNIALARGGG